MTGGKLVIVPCGRSKIWDRQPSRGSTPAADAYTGPLFKLNRAYAEQFGDGWVILSAKYGFIEPEFEIPGPYEVTFKRQNTNPIDTETLRRQVELLRLDDYSLVVGLGGAEYRSAITAAFASFSVPLVFPFAGLQIGWMMNATKQAIQGGHPGFESEGRPQ